jgi:hypothetical protein
MGTCLPSRWPETALVQKPTCRSLHSNSLHATIFFSGNDLALPKHVRMNIHTKAIRMNSSTQNAQKRHTRPTYTAPCTAEKRLLKLSELKDLTTKLAGVHGYIFQFRESSHYFSSHPTPTPSLPNNIWKRVRIIKAFTKFVTFMLLHLIIQILSPDFCVRTSIPDCHSAGV